MLDLRALAAEHRIRIDWEPPATSTGGVPDAERPWHVRVPGRRGHIGVWSTDRLYAHALRLTVFRELLAVPGAQVVQRGDSEGNVTFPPDQFAAVAAIIRPKRRRTCSPEVRARLRDQLAPYRFARTRGTDAISDPQTRSEGSGGPFLPSPAPNAS